MKLVFSWMFILNELLLFLTFASTLFSVFSLAEPCLSRLISELMSNCSWFLLCLEVMVARFYNLFAFSGLKGLYVSSYKVYDSVLCWLLFSSRCCGTILFVAGTDTEVLIFVTFSFLCNLILSFFIYTTPCAYFYSLAAVLKTLLIMTGFLSSGLLLANYVCFDD